MTGNGNGRSPSLSAWGARRDRVRREWECRPEDQRRRRWRRARRCGDWLRGLVVVGPAMAVAMATLVLGAACNPYLDPVGTKVGTSAGTIVGEAEACTIGEGTDVVHWVARRPADAVDASASAGGSVFYPGASGGEYLEAVDVDANASGLEFGDPGTAGVLRCPITLAYPGRYHLWVRAFAHGPGDNSAHAGLDGMWPESARAFEVCDKQPTRFDRWMWTSSQYISAAEPCREPLAITLDVLEAGAHTLMFSIREDGFRFDSWLLTLDQYLIPDPRPASVP